MDRACAFPTSQAADNLVSLLGQVSDRAEHRGGGQNGWGWKHLETPGNVRPEHNEILGGYTLPIIHILVPQLRPEKVATAKAFMVRYVPYLIFGYSSKELVGLNSGLTD